MDAPNRIPAPRGTAAAHVVSAAAWAAVLAFGVMLFSHNLADVDLWGNVGFVHHLPWQTGYLTTNTFSFTEPGHTWINHEWGAEYILNAVHTVSGNVGLLVLKVAIGMILLLLMDAELRRERISGPIRVGLLMLALSTLGYGFSTRPHLFTYLLTASLIALLRRNRLLTVFCLSPGMGCLWANLHGAFFVGLIVLFLALIAGTPAGRSRNQRRLLGGAALLFAAGTLANPYGVALWGFVTDSAGILRPYLSEWAPFHPVRDFADHSDFLALAVVVVATRLRARPNTSAFDTALTATALVAALAMRRNIPLFALCAGMCAGPWLERAAGLSLGRLVARMRPIGVGAALLGVMALCGWQIACRREAPLTLEIPAADFPVQTVNFLKHAAIRGNMLVFFDWAEYCIWKLYPDCRVFMDGRFRSAYSAEAIHDYLAFLYDEPGWERALNAYNTELVLVHRENPCVRRLTANDEWRLVLENEMAVLYARAATADRVAAQLRNAQGSWQPVATGFP